MTSVENTCFWLKWNKLLNCLKILGGEVWFRICLEKSNLLKKAEFIHLPINIPVRIQNTISYGKLTPESRDPFASCTKGRISAGEWFEILKKRVAENEKNKLPSVILIHPMTMAVLDNFELFEKIARFLSKYQSKKISEFDF